MISNIHHSKNGLNIIIVGCGKVGAALVEQLVREGHDITIIDKNPQKIQNYTNLYDIMGIVGNGASYSVQQEAGIENTDLIIAVTGSDELNLLCCTIAKQVGNCSAIARVRSPEYSEESNYLRERLGLAMIINPDLETAKEATHILCLPTALEVNSFAHNQAQLIKIQIPESNFLDNKSIAQISKSLNAKFLICAIERDGKIIIPSGNVTLHKGDKISFAATRRETINFLKQIGFRTNQVKDTMIIGGGKTAFYLAKILINIGISVKIIEQNKERCEELSILLPKATIINGDGTNEELLKEEGISTCKSFIPLTGIDEENIFLTLYASKISNAKVIT
ncbi:MAG: Trk system potassium transporter TrkA, partial [Pseudoruminococcus massiliensis]